MSLELKSVFQPVIDSRWFARLPTIVSLVMLAALTYTVAQLTWKLVPDPELPEVKVEDKNNRSVADKQAKSRHTLSEFHLFGEARRQTQPVARGPVKAPVTRLNLTLKGVIASGTPEIAKAIIADSSGTENFYGLGAKIPGGAILEEIHAAHVIIKRNDRLETLQLPKDAPGNRSVSARNTTKKRASNNVSTKLPATDYNKETSTILREFRDVLKTDPQKLMDLVRARPYRENGKLVGYKIRPGKDRKLLKKFGFKSGDIVTSVNGISLDNPINGLEIIKNLTSANAVAVDIKRAGVPQSLSFAVD